MTKNRRLHTFIVSASAGVVLTQLVAPATAEVLHADDVRVRTGDTPQITLEQTATGGFPAQSWEIGGNDSNFFVREPGTGVRPPFRIKVGAPQNALYVGANGYVGIGVGDLGGGSQVEEKLHVKDGNLKIEQTAAATSAILDFATASSSWEIKQNGDTGRLTFFSPGGGAITASFKFARQAQENLFRVGVVAADTVDINGKLVINGSQVTPDYVFDSDYRLESIEEHAEFMWKNKHLPALPGAAANEKGGVDIVSHQYGTLEELEKAHIYISQLNEQLKQQAEQMKKMELALAELQAQQAAQKSAGEDSLPRHSHAGELQAARPQ